MTSTRRVALVTLGCARNEVDSEELAARFAAGGFELVADAADADAVVVNTCGFVEQAKQDSIDTLLEARGLDADGRRRTVVAVGCLAERYGTELAAALPEADAVLGFDSYPDLAGRLGAIVRGERPDSHAPRDRRTLLPITPVDRAAARAAAPVALLDRDELPAGVAPASGPRPVRVRLSGGPVAHLKLASGCDRRCSFCAIPSFRGAFVSRPPEEVVGEAEWLAEQGVRELHLVSENSTSYGKDLGDVRLLERLLPRLAALPGITRVRVAYLQPAELRPGLLETIATTPGVAPYFDLSFQHSSPDVLRRMRRFGGTASFLDLCARIRELAPEAGIRSNFIVGFPGETAADYAELERFLTEARLDAIGVFQYSDEDGTEAASFEGKVRADVAARRYARVTTLAEALTAARAEERVGTVVEVLVEELGADGAEGRAHHQAPEVDGSVRLPGFAGPVGALVPARVVAAEGVDLVAEPL
ncbi:MAG TPA: 30S ribosomal protein S12 methylthiotransferase RimO [Frankiaceae bacterium]|nr:30S ribosomal protein S12 methylthiotransferase RimO [Frankiaceae bacterium]